MVSAEAWTPKAVGENLVEAFRALPGCPCLSRGGRLVEGHAPTGAVRAFNAVIDAVPNQFERRAVLTWARCRATEQSYSAQCRAMGWPKRTAEDARLRALRRVAAALRNVDPLAELG